MAGVQFFLRKRIDITPGHVTYVDSEWALTSLTQAQFWAERDFPADYGDGDAVDCLSVDVSDWDTPGPLTGKIAKRCTQAEIKREVWHQITEHLKDTDPEILDPDLVHSAFLDPGIQWHPGRGRNSNATPLLVNTVGSWDKRPEPKTALHNLFLCGDYVRNDIDLATMEGANETGRAATAALLEAVGLDRAAAADVQALRPARDGGREGRRPRALPPGPAERARRRGVTGAAVPAAERVDAVIVGARCAGSAAATALARAGRSVVCLDRASFPADTLSTHLLFLGGVVELERLGALDRVLALGPPRLDQASMAWGRYEIRTGYTPVDGLDYALCVRRPGLDAALVDTAREAGAEIREGCQALGCVWEAGRMAGVRYRDPGGAEREVRAPLVIGADGRRSLVAREAGVAETPRLYNANGRGCYFAYWRDGRPELRSCASQWRQGRELVTAFPCDDGLLLVLLMPPVDRADDFKGELEGEYRRTACSVPGLAARLDGAAMVSKVRHTNSTASYFRRSQGPGWALPGDAGHFKDPVTAQGIRDAMRFGRMLGEAVAPMLDDDPRLLDRGACRVGAQPRRRVHRDVSVDEPPRPRRGDEPGRGRALPPGQRGSGARPLVPRRDGPDPESARGDDVKARRPARRRRRAVRGVRRRGGHPPWRSGGSGGGRGERRTDALPQPAARCLTALDAARPARHPPGPRRGPARTRERAGVRLESDQGSRRARRSTPARG